MRVLDQPQVLQVDKPTHDHQHPTPKRLRMSRICRLQARTELIVEGRQIRVDASSLRERIGAPTLAQVEMPPLAQLLTYQIDLEQVRPPQMHRDSSPILPEHRQSLDKLQRHLNSGVEVASPLIEIGHLKSTLRHICRQLRKMQL
jgi:hypothetical protein